MSMPGDSAESPNSLFACTNLLKGWLSLKNCVAFVVGRSFIMNKNAGTSQAMTVKATRIRVAGLMIIGANLVLKKVST